MATNSGVVAVGDADPGAGASRYEAIITGGAKNAGAGDRYLYGNGVVEYHSGRKGAQEVKGTAAFSASTGASLHIESGDPYYLRTPAA